MKFCKYPHPIIINIQRQSSRSLVYSKHHFDDMCQRENAFLVACRVCYGHDRKVD